VEADVGEDACREDGVDGADEEPDRDPDGPDRAPEGEEEVPAAADADGDDDPEAADFALVPDPHADSATPPLTPRTEANRFRRPNPGFRDGSGCIDAFGTGGLLGGSGEVTGNTVGDRPRSLIRTS